MLCPDAQWRFRAAIRRFGEDWQGSCEAYEADVEEIVDLGNRVTFAVCGLLPL
jgi:hypothetical protein